VHDLLASMGTCNSYRGFCCSDTVQRYNRKWYNAVTTSAWRRRVEKQILALVSRFARLAHELYRIASGGDHEADDEGASLEDC
jgi:hypothetical protein